MYYLVKWLVLICLSLLFLNCGSARTTDLPKSAIVDLETVEKYTGEYRDEEGHILKVFVNEGKLYAQMVGNPRFELSKVEDSTFKNDYVEVSLKFEGNNSEIKGLTADRRGTFYHFKKVG